MSSRLAFQTQLASIMEVLANAAVAEICKLVDDDYALVSLQMSQCQRENKALKRKLHLLELKMARGAAERRLRDGGGRPRMQLTAGDRLRDATPASGGAFERRVEVSLWPDGAAGGAPGESLLSEGPRSQSPDVELVEPEALLVKEESLEALMVPAAEPRENVRLIGDDGVLDCAPLAAAVQRPPFQPQESQIQSSMKRGGGGGGGVEKSEELDVVLVKVEEAEPGAGPPSQKGLSIQEGLVESSTDEYRGVPPLDDPQSSSNPLSELQESGRGFSEVSYGHSSLWTNGGVGYEDGVPGPSSHCAPLSYVSGGGQGAGGAPAGESPPGFSAFPFEQRRLAVIDLSGESGSPPPPPGQASVQVHQFLDPGSSPGQRGAVKKLCVCSFCGKGFRSPANLESHLRTHTGERPYGCTVCGKKFSQFWNLKIHRNIHTGERPYRCPLCPERFSDPSNLKKHQKRHHPQGGGAALATA